MSLTSYRAAPPRGNLAGAAGSRDGLEEGTRCGGDAVGEGRDGCWTWRRPTLPRLETQYHGRFGVSRPSSEWGRVGHPRYRPPGRRTTPAAGLGRGWVGGKSLAWVPVGVLGPGWVLWWSLTGEEVIRAIRTGQLHASPRFHIRPIDVVVCHGSDRETWSCGGFPA